MANEQRLTDSNDPLTVNAYVRAGYEFQGWSKTADGAVDYADEDDFLMSAGGATIYAVWTANAYEIIYMINGGTAGTMANTPATYDASVTLRANAFTRAGYIFTGWNTRANGTGTAYANVATFTYMIAGNLTLYAQWELDGTGGPGDPPAPPVVTTTTTTTTTTTPPPPTPPAPPVIIPTPPTPLSPPEITPPVDIAPAPVPMASFVYWALLNLILTIVTGLVMVMLLATYFFKRKDENEDDPNYDEEKVKKHLGLRLITVAATVIAIILFILTQDMTLPMGMTDQWTIWHVVIAVAAIVLAFFSKKKYEEDEAQQIEQVQA